MVWLHATALVGQGQKTEGRTQGDLLPSFLRKQMLSFFRRQMLICWDQCFLQKHTGFDWTFHGCYFPRSGHNFQSKSEINLRRAETKGFRLPRGFSNHWADPFPECKQKQNSCKRRDHETLAQEEWVMQGMPLDVLEPQVLIWSWCLHSGKSDLCSLNLLGFCCCFFFFLFLICNF